MSNDKATPRPHIPEDCDVEQCPLCAPIFAARDQAKVITAATPRPWQYAVDGRGYSIRTVTKGIGERIATGILRLPDAALIVEAVNSHDALKAQNAELVEALRGALSHLAAINWSNRGDNPLVRARAALAKAGGKP